MAKHKHLQQTFTGGELSPAMYGRLDDQKYQQGLATCRNFLVLPQGPVQNRSGLSFLRAVKYTDKKTRLIPFIRGSGDTMVLEFGDHYMRVIKDGGYVPSAAGSSTPLEVATQYSADDVMDLHYAQSVDVITVVHPNYPPTKFSRTGAYSWSVTVDNFTAPLSKPTGLSGSYSCGDSQATESEKNAYAIKYKVTAIKEDDQEGDQESEASDVVSVTGNVYLTASKVSLSWSGVSGANRYRVYKTYSGVYGYIGETTDTSFVDNNIAADQSITPPRYDAPFTNSDYPGAVSYFEQRRIFAGSKNKPQFVWMTRPGTESDMHYTLPSQDDNRIKFRLAALEASRIRHVVPLSSLIFLTSSAEFRVITANDDALTPKSIGVKPQSYVGSNNVQPVIANSSCIYAAERGGHVWELGYNWQASGFVTGDMCLRAAHMFESKQIVDMAIAKAPMPVIWCVTSDGKLLGCTYVPDQGIGAWHWHDTKNGAFESIAVVPEGNEDILYAVVRRTINGATTRYVERMSKREVEDISTGFFVDSGVNDYYSTAQNYVDGLEHLEGETVAILADGKVMPQTKVVSGRVTFPDTAKRIIVGLPIQAEIKTLPVALQTQDGGYAQGDKKNVVRAFVRVYQSSGLQVGPTFDELVDHAPRRYEPYGTPPALRSEEIEIRLSPSWTDSGVVCLRQPHPLPMMICGITSEIAL